MLYISNYVYLELCSFAMRSRPEALPTLSCLMTAFISSKVMLSFRQSSVSQYRCLRVRNFDVPQRLDLKYPEDSLCGRKAF